MTNENIPQETSPTCTCGRPLSGDLIFVCSGCNRNAADCRCRGVMYEGVARGTGPGIFGAYSPRPIYNDRGTNTTGSRERRKADARDDAKVRRGSYADHAAEFPETR